MLVDINLLPEKERERSVFVIAALAIIGAALLVWLVLLFLSNGLTKESDKLGSQLLTVQQSQEELQATLQVSESVGAKKQLESTVEWTESYQLDTVPILKDTISLLPKRGFFRSFDFTGPNTALLTIQFDTSTEAAHYLSRLKSSSHLSDATLNSVITEELEDETENELENGTIAILPRYVAEYAIQIIDSRSLIEGTAEPSDESIPEEDLEEGGEPDGQSE